MLPATIVYAKDLLSSCFEIADITGQSVVLKE